MLQKKWIRSVEGCTLHHCSALIELNEKTLHFFAAGPCLTLRDSEREKKKTLPLPLRCGLGMARVWDVKANNSTCWLFQPAQEVWDLLTLRKR